MTDARARACVNVGKGKGAAKTEAKVRATRRAARRDERRIRARLTANARVWGAFASSCVSRAVRACDASTDVNVCVCARARDARVGSTASVG